MMGMMGGMMLIGALFCIALIAAVIWLVVRWLNNKQTPKIPYTLQQQNPYQMYEHGYQPPSQQSNETYQEGEKQYDYPQQPQYDQPQAQYPQQPQPPQH